jgi:hypothetical protein
MLTISGTLAKTITVAKIAHFGNGMGGDGLGGGGVI